MIHLDFLMATIIVFLGIIIGTLLAFIAPEELKPGIKYFSLMKKILMVAIALIFIYQYLTEVWLLLLMAVFVGYYFYLANFAKKESKEKMIYFLMGFILFLSYEDATIFLVQASLIFLYGLPEGTLFANQFIGKKKCAKLNVIKHLLLNYCPFLLTSLLPSILFEF